MKEAGLLLPLLPLIVSLASVPVLWALPSGGVFASIRRIAYVLVLVSTFALLVAVRAGGEQLVGLPFWRPISVYPETIEFSTNALALDTALLITGTLALVGISMLARPMERFEAVSALLLAGATLGTCMAANLLTLCLMWALGSLALLSTDVMRVPDESIPHAIRSVLGNVVSTVALVIATVLVTVERDETLFSTLVLTGTPLRLLMLAALLRLNIYPLPGSLRRRWEAHLASLCTGGYLWLRIATLTTGTLPGSRDVLPLCQGAVLVTGLLAGLAPDLATALPYLLANGIAMLVLAPLLNPNEGFPVAYATLINLALCLALLRVDVQVRPAWPLGRWTRFPLGVALASLAGWPLTLGFAAKWAFFKLCWTNGLRSFAWLGSAASALASVPVWWRLRQIRREVKDDPSLPKWPLWSAFVSAMAISVTLLLLGLVPSLLGGPISPGVFISLSWRTLLSGGVTSFVVLLAIAFLLPLAGGFGLQHLIAAASKRLAGVHRNTPLLDAMSTLLELDWLYALLETLLARLRNALERGTIMIEESFYLGWTLLWGLVVMLYFVGG